MTKIDYQNNAAERIKQALKHPDTGVALSIAAIAQAEATLALAEQQRIANLLALAQFTWEAGGTRLFTNEEFAMKLRTEASEALRVEESA